MGNVLEDRVGDVTVINQDDSIVGTNLNLALILTNESPQAVISGRTKEYFTIDDILSDWGATSKVYKASVPHFIQQPHNNALKIGLQRVKGYSEGLQNNKAVVVATNVATVTNIAHGLETGDEISSFNAYDSGLNGTKIVTGAPTADTFTFAAAGVGDGSGILDYYIILNKAKAVAVVSNVATVTNVAHGLGIGDEITNSDAYDTALNGVKTIASVPTVDTFTFSAAGVGDGSGTLDYHTGDASITAALGDIYEKDSNWFQFLSIYKNAADIKEMALWVESKNLKYTFSVEDINIYDVDETTDLFSFLEGQAYSKTSGYWYHKSGVDVDSISITVADEIGTVTSANHGLRVNDNVTISNADKSALNGNKIVLSVVDIDNFTIDADGAADGADANNGAINYFARYEFLETGVEAELLGENETDTTGIGSSSWANKQIIGFEATPDDILSPTQGINVLNKNGNIYKDLKGAAQTQGGLTFSGRTIKVQTVSDWLEVRMQEAILQALLGNKQFIYTNGSLAKGANALSTPLNTQITRGGITAYTDPVTGQTANYFIDYKRAAEVPEADKLNNVMKYDVKTGTGTEILKFEVAVTVVT